VKTVFYRKKRAGAGDVSAPELARLLLEALLDADEAAAAGPAPPDEDEELARRLREAARRIEGAEEVSGEELLRKMRGLGWLQREEGGVGYALAPQLLRALELRALRRLFAPPLRRQGSWPRAGGRGPHEPHGPEERWRWGEPLRLDAAATLKAALPRGVAELEPGDLRVRAGEGGRRLALALLLDCSHSMVLYGVDRFAPAKRAALALAHWVRAAGGWMQAFCIHDLAEPIPEGRLPFVRVLPSHTNTAAGLSRAHAWLRRRPAEERVAVLITDGRPTAVETAVGEVYKNAWGFDPLIRERTLAEGVRLRRLGAELQIYLLGEEDEARRFNLELARRARGRLVQTGAGELGSRLLLDLKRLRSA